MASSLATSPGFNNLALNEMVGLTWNPAVGAYQGWGGNWQRSAPGTPGFAANALGIEKTSAASKWTHGLSGLRLLGTGYSVYLGAKEEGVWGAAKWLGAEFLTSGLIASAAAGGLGLGGQMGMTAGGIAGMALTGGSPFGYVAGTAITGVAGTAITGAAISNPFTAGLVGGAVVTGVAAAVGAYYTAKGTYHTLKNGYNYRQRMMTKLDTAGSTAAFMNKNAFTMRSRAVEAIRNNHLNARSAIGHEAELTHFNAYRKIANTKVY